MPDADAIDYRMAATRCNPLAEHVSDKMPLPATQCQVKNCVSQASGKTTHSLRRCKPCNVF